MGMSSCCISRGFRPGGITRLGRELQLYGCLEPIFVSVVRCVVQPWLGVLSAEDTRELGLFRCCIRLLVCVHVTGGARVCWDTRGGYPPGNAGGGVNARLREGSRLDGFSPLVGAQDMAFSLRTDRRRTQGGATLPSTPWLGMWSG